MPEGSLEHPERIVGGEVVPRKRGWEVGGSVGGYIVGLGVVKKRKKRGRKKRS